MMLDDYVSKNKHIIEWLENKDHNTEMLGKYFGTIDYATSRFNTILLKLSQDKIKYLDREDEVDYCFNIIQNFFNYTIKYQNASLLTKWYYKCCLHGLGINQIPKIKKLLNSINIPNT